MGGELDTVSAFEFSLDLMLDGLRQILAREATPPARRRKTRS